MPLFKIILSFLAMSGIGSSGHHRWSHGLMLRVVRALAFTAATVMMTVASVLTCFIIFYHYLLGRGIPEMDALFYTLGGLVIVTIALGSAAFYFMRHLISFAKVDLKEHAPLTTHIATEASSVVNAFLDGFMNKPAK